MTEQLKPCPFCGNTDLKSGGDDKIVGVWCENCQMAGPNHYGGFDWNTRPSATPGNTDPIAKYDDELRKVQGGHPDDHAVDRFAAAMKIKLAEARAKGRSGWETDRCSDKFLADELIDHIAKGNTGTFQDVANYSMMLHERGASPHELAAAYHVAQSYDANPTPTEHPTEQPSVRAGAVDALAAYQQADQDGIMVLVSRQAIEECLPALRSLAQEGE